VSRNRAYNIKLFNKMFVNEIINNTITSNFT